MVYVRIKIFVYRCSGGYINNDNISYNSGAQVLGVPSGPLVQGH